MQTEQSFYGDKNGPLCLGDPFGKFAYGCMEVKQCECFMRAPLPVHRQSSGEVSYGGTGQGVRAPLPAHRQSMREVSERGGRQRVRAPQPAHRQSSGEVSERGRGQGVRAPLPAHRQLLKVASDSVAGRAWGECTTEMFLDSCFITHPVLVPPADQ